MSEAGPQHPPPSTPPAAVGDAIKRTDRYSREDIEAFALACRDRNPLHSSAAQAQLSRFGEVIASGQHTSSMLLGLATSHFARPLDAPASEVLVLHVNFAFSGPVFANEDVHLTWQVMEIARNAKLGGHVLLLNGGARTARPKQALVARASLLVKSALERP